MSYGSNWLVEIGIKAWAADLNDSQSPSKTTRSIAFIEVCASEEYYARRIAFYKWTRCIQADIDTVILAEARDVKARWRRLCEENIALAPSDVCVSGAVCLE